MLFARYLHQDNTHTQETGIDITEGIRTPNPNKQVATDPSLRQRSYWNRLSKPYNRYKLYWKVEAMGFMPSQGQDILFFSTAFGRPQYFAQGVHRLCVWSKNVFLFLVIVQLEAQILFNVFIYLYFSTCFEHVMLIIRRNKLYQYSFW